MNEDKIEINGSWEYAGNNKKLLKVKLRINGEDVKWNDIDLYSIALNWSDHKSEHFPEFTHSAFTPFTCSCGVYGCAGIGDGIYIKERKYSFEWRAKKSDGYGFLGKSFFSFEKHHYMSAFNKFFFWLMMESDVDNKLCVDLGYYDGGETTVEEFFAWLGEYNK